MVSLSDPLLIASIVIFIYYRPQLTSSSIPNSLSLRHQGVPAPRMSLMSKLFNLRYTSSEDKDFFRRK